MLGKRAEKSNKNDFVPEEKKKNQLLPVRH